MTANEYQSLAWSTARPFYKASTDNLTFNNLQLAVIVLSLVNKSGELADLIKGHTESGEILDYKFREKYLERLGDIQWFVSVAGQMMNLNLEHIMQMNISKLREKYPTGVLQDKNTKF